jgi:DNA-binding transcriptional LysR family regulator
MASPTDMTAFVRAVDLGGFSAAARELSLSPSAVSKLVSRLEERLGVRLLNRTTRHLALTPEGEAYFARSQRIMSDIADAESEVAGFRERPRGKLRLNVGVALGLHQLSQVLPEFYARYPEIEVDLTITDRKIDLIEHGADVVVRVGPLDDSTLVAKKICDFERVICASPAYLARHGTPKLPEDLLKHNCITFSEPRSLRRWPFDTAKGMRTIEVRGNLLADNAESLLQAAVQGVGITRLADVIAGDAVRAGLLKPVLVDCHHVEPVPLYAVWPHGRHRSPKVVALVDFLVEKFASAPWRTAARRRKKA